MPKPSRDAPGRPSDLLRQFENGLKKNLKEKDEVLNELEQYYNWFLPLLSSIFILAIGVGLDQDSQISSSALYFWVALGLFLALLTSLISRFAIFQYWKMKRETVIPLQNWAMRMFAELRKAMDAYVPDLDTMNRIQAGEKLPSTPERIKYVEESSDEFFALLTKGLPNAIGEGLGIKFKPQEYKEFARAVSDKLSHFQTLKSGPGAWAMRFFYCGHFAFLLALALMLVLLANRLFDLGI